MPKPFIGIKQIFYGNVINAAVTPATLNAWLKTATEVKNSHDGTWLYSQDDPETTDYINELSGKPYYRDKTSNGTKTIAFTMGAYDYEDKVALQGGKVVKDGDDVVGWEAPTTIDLISKAVVGLTKTGVYVVFTNANIISKVDTQEKNLGLGLTAVAMDNQTEGVSDEYWIDKEAVDDAA